METTRQGSVTGLLVRGGTSKGLFVRDAALPADPEARDELVLELFGSPDTLQVDGIGGSHSHTSKLMVVDPSDRAGVDVDYTFGQVGVDEAVVDYTGNCGNLTSAVGAYAMHAGLVEPDGSPTAVTLYNTNTDTVVEQSVPTVDGEPAIEGEYAIDGVPGTGARIDSRFVDPAGGITDALLPTGAATETVPVDGTAYEVSVVDAANPVAFVRAADLGLSGTELPDALREDTALVDTVECIRGVVCHRLGLVDDPADARSERPGIPQVALVSEPQSSERSTGGQVAADEVDVTARAFTNGKPHHAYPVTGAMCLAATVHLPGTIPAEVADVTPGQDAVVIGHPKGRIEVGTDVTVDGDTPEVRGLTVGRTARVLVEGRVFYRPGEVAANLDPTGDGGGR